MHTRAIRIWFVFYLLLCAAALGFSLFLFAESAAPQPPAAYLVRDEGGLVAVTALNEDGTPGAVQRYDIYVNLLPENDALRLKHGIRLTSDEELARLLEDLGG